MPKYNFSRLARRKLEGDATQRMQKKRQHYWESTFLQRPYQLLTTILLVAILVTIEVAWQQYRRRGYLFTTDVDRSQFSNSITFVYKYLPTLIGVIFMLLWSVVDYNAKRLEPFFQLSSRSGSTNKEILKLKYVFNFDLFVPFRAARNGYERSHYMKYKYSRALWLSCGYHF